MFWVEATNSNERRAEESNFSQGVKSGIAFSQQYSHEKHWASCGAWASRLTMPVYYGSPDTQWGACIEAVGLWREWVVLMY